jgi:uncharacterized protein (UPF0335 family)
MAEKLRPGDAKPNNATPGPGHNAGGVSGDRLRSFVERVERLNGEKAALQTDISAVFAEAKSAGFDVPVLREIIKLRKMDAEKREVREMLMDEYRHALGLFASTPLGESAIAAAAAQ